MSDISVRHVAEHCLGLAGDISINTDLYGYPHRGEDGSVFGTLEWTDVLPESGTADEPTARSLRRHLETVSGVSVDLVIFLVGHEQDFSGQVKLDDVTKVQYAIQVARDLYAQIDFGIRRITWRRVGMAEAGDYIDIGGSNEARRLTREFSGPPGAIDVFVVRSIEDQAGLSPVPGPTDKDQNWPKSATGVLVALLSYRQWCGQTIAHEVGHYLGLEHVEVDGNLLCGNDPGPFGANCLRGPSDTDLTTAQRDVMRSHPFAHAAC